MEVNSSISNLMREWLTEGMDRDADKLKSFVPPTTVFQPRPERWVYVCICIWLGIWCVCVLVWTLIN